MKLPKHHYIPEFYLKQWASPEDGRLFEFCRRHQNKIMPRRTYPGGTGYVRGLNISETALPELREQFETVLMQQVDNRAHEALQNIFSGGEHWDAKVRSGWTRFIISLMFRNPEALELIRIKLTSLPLFVNPNLKMEYDALAKSGEPDFETYMRNDRGGLRFQFVQSMLNQPIIGEHINNMIWQLVSFDKMPFTLLTSDRPFRFTKPPAEPGAIVMLPIGPQSIFVAANTMEDFERLKRIPARRMIVDMNAHVVERAIRFVWGADTTNLRFIENRFGKKATADLSYMDLEASVRRTEEELWKASKR